MCSSERLQCYRKLASAHADAASLIERAGAEYVSIYDNLDRESSRFTTRSIQVEAELMIYNEHFSPRCDMPTHRFVGALTIAASDRINNRRMLLDRELIV